HTYWINPGDSGEPLSIEWTLPEGFEAGPIHWPVPDKIKTGPLASYGYHDKVVLLQEMTAPRTLPEGPVTLKADIDLLVCAEICIPESSTHEFTLNGAGEARDNIALIDEAFEAMPVEADWPATFREEGGQVVIALELFLPAALDNRNEGALFTLVPKD